MPSEYTVTASRPAAPSTRPHPGLGYACAASGVVGAAVGVFTLAYPAAVPKDRWSYPFGADVQWVVSSVLALTHLLTLAGVVGVLAVAAYGRSRAAVLGLWAAGVGLAGLAVCELLSGWVGTRREDSSVANVVGGLFGVASLLTAVGCIVAGAVIVRRRGIRDVGWSMVLCSGLVLALLVTPAQLSGSDAAVLLALIVWSLTFVPLGRTLARAV